MSKNGENLPNSILGILIFTSGLLWLAPTWANPAAKALLDDAEQIESQDRKRAIEKIEQALAMLSQSPSDLLVRTEAQVKLCWIRADGEAAVALQYVETVLKTEKPNASASADLHLCRGYALEQVQKNVEAMKEYEFVVIEADRIANQKLLADALMLRGEMHYVMAEYANALADLKRSYDLNIAIGRASKESYVLNAIANLYADANVGEYDRAIEYYRKLLANHEKADNKREMATAHYNLGSTLERKKDFDAALNEYRLSRELDRREHPLEAMYAQRSIGIVLTKLNRAKEALPLLEEAIAAFEAAHDEDRTAQTRLSRGVALRYLGKGREALRDLEFAREYFEKEKNDRFLEKTHDERAQVLSVIGDWQGAAQARELQLALLRKLSDSAKAQQTSRLRVQFDSERKEQENASLTAENMLRKQALASASEIERLQRMALLLGALAIVALAFLVYRQFIYSRRLRELAMTDELTRLPNRRHLIAVAEAQLAHAKRDGKVFTVLAIDIDHFKRINDQFGHDAGDVVLQRVAQTCRRALRANDIIGRTGGEEFIAILPTADASIAADIAERVRVEISSVNVHDISEGLTVTVSIGLAQWLSTDRLFSMLAKRADEALYLAKTGGRNRIVVA